MGNLSNFANPYKVRIFYISNDNANGCANGCGVVFGCAINAKDIATSAGRANIASYKNRGIATGRQRYLNRRTRPGNSNQTVLTIYKIAVPIKSNALMRKFPFVILNGLNQLGYGCVFDRAITLVLVF